MADDGVVTPNDVIDLREHITCTACGEPLAISLFHGDPSTLLCSECAAAVASPATTVTGRASTFAPVG